MNTHPLKILLIEDEIAYADWIEAILDGYDLPAVEIKHAKRLQEALVYLSQNNYDAILLDLSLPDSQGMSSILQVRQKNPNIPIIVLTLLNDQNLALEAVRQGVQDYLIKGNFKGDLLIRSIRYAIERKRTEVTLRQQASMKKMLDRIRQSLDLQEILDSTVVAVSQYLNVDRVIIYRRETGKLGKVIAESNTQKEDRFSQELDFLQLHSTLAGSKQLEAIEDTNKIEFQEQYSFSVSQIRAVLTLAIKRNSVVNDSLDTYSVLSHQIEANFLPSSFANTDDSSFNFNFDRHHNSQNNSHSKLNSDRKWGVLVAYNYHNPRKWQPEELEFLQQLTTQVTIAIQQSELYRQLQDANQKLEKLAILDGLTEVANRRYFDYTLSNEWQRLAREQKPLSLLLCDIDYFKLYNDTYGHPAGDRCLQAVAKILKASIKRPADLVARYGGEEFAVILPDTDAEGAVFVANNIRQNLTALQLTHEKSKVKPYVTLSIGLATDIPKSREESSTLIDRADRFLYQAKQRGRDCIVTKEANAHTANYSV